MPPKGENSRRNIRVVLCTNMPAFGRSVPLCVYLRCPLFCQHVAVKKTVSVEELRNGSHVTLDYRLSDKHVAPPTTDFDMGKGKSLLVIII